MVDVTSQHTDSRSDAVDPTEVRTQLDRVLGHPSFATAPQLSRLLQRLVESALVGDRREIKEYALGVELFGRGRISIPVSTTSSAHTPAVCGAV